MQKIKIEKCDFATIYYTIFQQKNTQFCPNHILINFRALACGNPPINISQMAHVTHMPEMCKPPSEFKTSSH